MRLEWSAFAIADREAIFAWVATDSPRAAVILDERIERRIEALIAFPESGRPGRVEGTRELMVVGTSYIAAYQVTGDAMRILRLLHMARLWPEDFP